VEKEYNAVSKNISAFVLALRNDFPEIMAFGVGVPVEDFEGRNPDEISEEEAYSKLTFCIFHVKNIPPQRKQEILIHIVERFFRFKTVGGVPEKY